MFSRQNLTRHEIYSQALCITSTTVVQILIWETLNVGTILPFRDHCSRLDKSYQSSLYKISNIDFFIVYQNFRGTYTYLAQLSHFVSEI